MAHCDNSLRVLDIDTACGNYYSNRSLVISEGALIRLCVHRPFESQMRPKITEATIEHGSKTCASFTVPKDVYYKDRAFVANTPEAAQLFLDILAEHGITEDDLKNHQCTIERIEP